MGQGRDTEGQRGKYRIGAVARMTGISTHALRAWERRYDGVNPERTESGGRLYSDADVARFRVIRQLLDRGHAIRELITLPIDHLTSRLASHGSFDRENGPVATPEVIVSEFVDAISRLDVHEADRALARSVVSYEPRQLVLEIITPLIEALCVRHDQGELRAVHCNLATSLLQSFLSTLHRLYVGANESETVLCATGAKEPHEFGALLGAFISTMHGKRALYLGPQLTADDVSEVVRRTGCARVLLACVEENNPKLSSELMAIAERLPAEVELALIGRAAPRYRAWVPRAKIVPEATELHRFFEDGQAPDGAARETLAKVKCSL